MSSATFRCAAFAAVGLTAVGLIGAPGAVAARNGELAFITSTGGPFPAPLFQEVRTVDRNGAGGRLILRCTVGASEDNCPFDLGSWSFDQSRLLLNYDGVSRLRIVRADGSLVRRFPGLTGFERSPSFSPRAGAVAFGGVFDRVGSATNQVYRINSDGTSLRRLTGRGGAEPDWGSNDRIVFVRRSNLYLMRSSGTRLRRLTRAGGGEPKWSPRASTVVFVRRGNVHTLQLRDGRVRRLTGAGGETPGWSPDGRRIVFERGGDLYIIRPDGSDLRRFVNLATDVSAPSWRAAP